MKMTLGAEPKKVAWLCGLLAVLVVVWIFNNSEDPEMGGNASASATKPPLAKAPPEVGALPPAAGPIPRRTDGAPKRQSFRQQMRGSVQDFKPKLYDKDNPVDPTKVDPTLLTQTIAKLQSVTLAGSGRSLFDFGAVPAPVTDLPKVLIKPAPKPKGNYPLYGPPKPEDPKPVMAEVKAPPPPPPPIPLKFYGFVSRAGLKRAFFMEGEDIYIAAEGEAMKGGKYKLIRIGVNSAVVEDTANKNQQALPLIEEQNPAGPGND